MRGFVNEKCGLFLFLPESDTDSVTRVFAGGEHSYKLLFFISFYIH